MPSEAKQAAEKGYIVFHCTGNESWGAPFKPFFGLSGIPQSSTCPLFMRAQQRDWLTNEFFRSL